MRETFTGLDKKTKFMKSRKCKIPEVSSFYGDILLIGSDNHLGDGVEDESSVAGRWKANVHYSVQPSWS